MWFVVIILGLFLLYIKRDKQEDWLLLKLLGYFILGAFQFNLNGLVLPIGFAISLFLKPINNRGVKRGASIFGLIVMIIGYIL